MNSKSGISLLDVIILILIAGVIAALLVPKARLQKIERAEVKCRITMQNISDAMMKFFDTAGDTTLLHPKPAPVDTTPKPPQPPKKGKKTTAPIDTLPPIQRLFTDDTTLLMPYMPKGSHFVCPLDDRPLIILARDSLFYSISCPNGHGQVIRGQATWEDN